MTAGLDGVSAELDQLKYRTVVENILGSLIGPLTFILLIDDLRLHCLTHKYVDDTTLSELLPHGSPDSAMQSYLQDPHVWTTHNKIQQAKGDDPRPASKVTAESATCPFFC